MIHRTTHAELIKLKRSGVLWLSVAGTLLTNVMIATLAHVLPKVSIDGVVLESKALENWSSWIRFHYDSTSNMLLPMFIVIICALTVHLENQHNTWKIMYTSPTAPKWHFLGKLSVVIIVFSMAHLLFVMLMIIGPKVFIDHFSEPFPFKKVMFLYLSTIVSSLGIISLVLTVSYLFKAFILPLAVGILGFVLGQLILDAGISAFWFPFSIPALSTSRVLEAQELSFGALFSSVISFLAFSLLGVYLSPKKRIH